MGSVLSLFPCTKDDVKNSPKSTFFGRPTDEGTKNPDEEVLSLEDYRSEPFTMGLERTYEQPLAQSST